METLLSASMHAPKRKIVSLRTVLADIRQHASCSEISYACPDNSITKVKMMLVAHSLTPRRYNPCRVLADSRSRLQPSLFLALILQFVIPSLSASLVTPSIHLRFGLSARFLPSGLSKVIFLHGRLSCIRTVCPAHLSLVVTQSASSYRRYSSSLYLDLHVASSQIGP
jgi:hypothetical protein